MFSKNDIVYCDANFLIAYGAKKVKQPELQKRALILFAKILASKCRFIVSSLTFDEAWLGIKRELSPKSVQNKWKLRADELLRKVGLRFINNDVLNFSYYEVFDDLNYFTNKLLDHENFSVVQFENANNGVRNALDNLNNLKLQPRDSFHLAFAKDNRATYFLTNDSHFLKKKENIEMNIINF
jgi:predicted nucleic acid-binding protein